MLMAGVVLATMAVLITIIMVRGVITREVLLEGMVVMAIMADLLLITMPWGRDLLLLLLLALWAISTYIKRSWKHPDNHKMFLLLRLFMSQIILSVRLLEKAEVV
jgi:hypothetical protein